jgi:hypothetical protein
MDQFGPCVQRSGQRSKKCRHDCFIRSLISSILFAVARAAMQRRGQRLFKETMEKSYMEMKRGDEKAV